MTDVPVVIFSGAGLSAQAPAGMPGGFRLRDDLLAVLHAGAMAASPTHVSRRDLETLISSGRKLEVVLGRLFGVAGDDALRCLLALHVDVPNEAHLLSALHLLSGGTHATLNFDVGIEIAYDLLTGRAELPPWATSSYNIHLDSWRRLVPDHAPPLRVVASNNQFAEWARNHQPPALLKLHGSLARDQAELVDVVVIDTEELGLLTAPRAAAVDSLGTAGRLLIVGYSGADPDVYQPLLRAAERTKSIWSCLALSTLVHEEAQTRGIEVHLGSHGGLATHALRESLNLGHAPLWPSSEVAPLAYERRFGSWKERFVLAHGSVEMAEAWAWLFADAGELDTADAVLSEVLQDGGRVSTSTRLRHAEVLYTRASGSDRDRAANLYEELLRAPGLAPDVQFHCRLRRADIARGRAVRGGARVLANLTRATVEPVRVLAATHGGRGHPEAAADAYRLLQQTWLRLIERGAIKLPTWTWWVLSVWCHLAIRVGIRAEHLAANGNRRAMVRVHRMTIQALDAVLTGRTPPPDLGRSLYSMHDTYLHADDVPGAGNCSAALALVAAANGDYQRARLQVAEARREYGHGRTDGTLNAAGANLTSTIDRLLIRLETAQPGLDP